MTRSPVGAEPDAHGKGRGSVTPRAKILVALLAFGAWALVSASQLWSVRLDAHSVAAAAARAGAQGDPASRRSGGGIDEAAAIERAQAIIAISGYSGDVSVAGATVTVTVSADVGYAFPAPGFPETVRESATAAAQRDIGGREEG